MCLRINKISVICYMKIRFSFSIVYCVSRTESRRFSTLHPSLMKVWPFRNFSYQCQRLWPKSVLFARFIGLKSTTFSPQAWEGQLLKEVGSKDIIIKKGLFYWEIGSAWCIMCDLLEVQRMSRFTWSLERPRSSLRICRRLCAIRHAFVAPATGAIWWLIAHCQDPSAHYHSSQRTVRYYTQTCNDNDNHDKIQRGIFRPCVLLKFKYWIIHKNLNIVQIKNN